MVSILILAVLPLVLVLLAARVARLRMLIIQSIVAVGGYGYIFFREMTKHHGERSRKREFLERVAPRSVAMYRRLINTKTPPPFVSARSPNYVTVDPIKPSQANSGGLSHYRQKEAAPADYKIPPLIRAPSAPLVFTKTPSIGAMKLSRQYSAQPAAIDQKFKFGVAA